MLTTERVVIFFTLWVSFAWGVLYMFFPSVVQTFEEAYGFGIMSTGLIQLSISVGAIIATAINPIQDRAYLRSARRNKERPGKPIPESLLFTAGLFLYGWTCRSSHPLDPNQPAASPVWAWASTASTWASSTT